MFWLPGGEGVRARLLIGSGCSCLAMIASSASCSSACCSDWGVAHAGRALVRCVMAVARDATAAVTAEAVPHDVPAAAPWPPSELEVCLSAVLQLRMNAAPSRALRLAPLCPAPRDAPLTPLCSALRDAPPTPCSPQESCPQESCEARSNGPAIDSHADLQTAAAAADTLANRRVFKTPQVGSGTAQVGCEASTVQVSAWT